MRAITSRVPSILPLTVPMLLYCGVLVIRSLSSPEDSEIPSLFALLYFIFSLVSSLMPFASFIHVSLMVLTSALPSLFCLLSALCSLLSLLFF